MKQIRVIKIGGNVIDNAEALSHFVERFAALEGPKILIHGGGKLATRLAQQMEVEVKMVEGRMQKYYKEVCLLEQQFVKNPDITVKDMLKAKGASKVLQFVRFEKGEGIEKRQENFAEEIAKMTK